MVVGGFSSLFHFISFILFEIERKPGVHLLTSASNLIYHAANSLVTPDEMTNSHID